MKYLYLLLLPLLAACGDSGPFHADKITAIHYQFYCSGFVQGQHNDYDIYIKPGEALFVANSFGTEIKRQSTPITEEDMNALVKILNDANLQEGMEATKEPCPKQYEENLTIFEDDKSVYWSILTYCESDQRPKHETTGDLDAAFEAIFSLVPGLDELKKK